MSTKTVDGHPCENEVGRGQKHCYLHGGGAVFQDAPPSTGTLLLEPSTFSQDELLSPYSDPYEHELDDLIPQANSVSKIAAVVDAIDDGCATSKEIAEAVGMSERQGAYYPNAAYTLGLVEKTGSHPTTWGLSELGARMVGLDAEERTSLMAEIVGYNKYVNTFIQEGPEGLTSTWDLELADSTIERRLATIESWTTFVYDTDTGEQAAAIQADMDGAKLRAPGIVARRPKPEKIEKQYCPGCFTELPMTGVCGTCG